MYILTDTFNKVKISTHRTIVGAVKARQRHGQAVAKRNGKGSYLHYSITSTNRANEYLGDEILAAQHSLSY